MKLLLTRFSLRYPWIVVGLTLAATLFFASRFPRVNFDNDPENMLSADEPVRIFHNQVKAQYDLYDFVIVGIVNEAHPDGIFNVETLGRIYDLTAQLLRLRQGPDGLPEVVQPARNDFPEQITRIDLTPEGRWRRVLNLVFRQEPNRLFDADGNSSLIAREIISPSVVDNIKQAEFGALKIEYLMETPPATRAEALRIRADAMGNPLYRGTLVSEDEKALCLYLPLIDKTYSYNVAALVRRLTAEWPLEDRVFITGQPVAQDTFGVEMLVQMATSAPLAGMAIFLLMLLFFRRVSLVVAPMIVAVVSVICAMGLLIGLGFDVHIMSSMIAIFLMPIAVADAIHILSEFFDCYHRFENKEHAVRHVIGHLFMPMLYTSLTTIAGFASLAATPIPPVRVFGLHVAFGVGVAWLLTMTLIPAYIMLAIPARTLISLCPIGGSQSVKRPRHGLDRWLGALGRFSYLRWKWILSLTVVILAVSMYGIARIRVNDNPVKWFSARHEIRVADDVLNAHFGGTYTAYLTIKPADAAGSPGCRDKARIMRLEARERFGPVFPEATDRFMALLALQEQKFSNLRSSDLANCFYELAKAAEALDEEALHPWRVAADRILYLDPDPLTRRALLDDLVNSGSPKVVVEYFEKAIPPDLAGEALLDAALTEADAMARRSFRDFVLAMETELTAPLLKQPAMLRYIETLQAHLAAVPVVGKTSSVVDALKKAAYELRFVGPPADASSAELARYAERNDAHYAIPDTAAIAGQVYIQLEGMKKRDSLFHLVTRDYREANIWVQLRSGDNRDMETVVTAVAAFLEAHPPPAPLETDWAGLTYLNVVWQDRMVHGMIGALAGSFIVVLVMMAVLFRSPLLGLLAMMPLSATIILIYGIIGLAGKDYDMPVAILSALTLGLSVDFAIHFIERARETAQAENSWKAVIEIMFKEPAMAISRNAITLSIGFTPLLFAPLVPYQTVGFFLATIMAVSWLATLLLLSALMTMLRSVLFKPRKESP